MVNHLGVVIGREIGFPKAVLRNRHPADKIGEPRDGRLFQFRRFMPVVIDVPRFVSDHEVILLYLQHLLKNHEVFDQDFVHAADRLERIQVVFSGIFFDVGAFVGQKPAGRVRFFTIGVQNMIVLNFAEKRVCRP